MTHPESKRWRWANGAWCAINAPFFVHNSHFPFSESTFRLHASTGGKRKSQCRKIKDDGRKRKRGVSIRLCDETAQKVEISAYILRRKRQKAAPARAEIKLPAHYFTHNLVSSQSASSQKAQAGRPKHSKLKQAEGRG